MDESESKSFQEMDIRVNARKLKDTKDEEYEVTAIEVIKEPGYFKQLKCVKELSNNLNATCGR